MVIPALSIMHWLGMMSASHVVVPLDPLHMRKIHRLNPSHWCLGTVSPSIQSDLWGYSPLIYITHILVYTNTFLFGCGGMCLSQAVGGKWRQPKSLYTNCRELSKHFALLLSNKRLMDNKTAASHIKGVGCWAQPACCKQPEVSCCGFTETCTPSNWSISQANRNKMQPWWHRGAFKVQVPHSLSCDRTGLGKQRWTFLHKHTVL